jgi:hypothetical protein
MTHTKTLQEFDLRQFTGTEHWYRHPLAQAIAAVAAEAFQFWILTVKPDYAATLVYEDGNGKIVHTQEIPFTDFPLPVIKFYVTDNVILLPSEY